MFGVDHLTHSLMVLQPSATQAPTVAALLVGGAESDQPIAPVTAALTTRVS